MPAPLAKGEPSKRVHLAAAVPRHHTVHHSTNPASLPTCTSCPDANDANLLAGPGSSARSASPSTRTRRAPHRSASNSPFATGLIIAASVIVAAGLAIYESPQFRQWVDQSRRKIAVALHSLGDEIQPRRPSESSEDFEERKRRQRDELIRKNRNDLIRRAREEGIAVDLDELARIGQEDVELAERRQRRATNASQKSFDDLVGSDGMLKKDQSSSAAHMATGNDASSSGLRHRGAAGFAAGSFAAAAMANPFSDDHVLFDHDAEEAQSPQPFTYTEPNTRESSATVEGEPVSPPPAAQLIDLTPESVYLLAQPENPQTASIPASEIASNADPSQSFYSFTSEDHPDDEAEMVSTGTLTPRSDRSGFTGASVVGSQADDIGVMSMQNDTDHDARSEIFSEGGFTEADFSEAGFSEVGENRGIMTPSSWTDVGSDDESEWGGPAQGGQVSQVQQH
ncbi:hypothetical protein BU23DRAFT_551515 [Bimuria novae-zelandiae CBS 107.79]|uniref:Uncharacterized protein n=1 Tax=Bimuria novae-zelandiae CBS 107.79 TaxID=1447943 RepID=A0A6A5VNR5_9PLEO|nr:hypothetical protein BU23DRAFT_551515 [Bimuria novae-zelandiae CBS 107.79]